MPNYTLYSIPAYLTLALVPHTYSVYYLSTNRKRWDNANPRGTQFAASLSKSLPPNVLAKYERLRAAHNNMLENMSFFVGAVLAGAVMKLDAGFMNQSVAVYLGTRVAYLASYATNESQGWSRLRSVLYTAGIVVLSWIHIKSGQKLVAETI